MNPQVDQTSVRNPASSVTHLERPLYGLMAEFTEHDQLLDAARRAYAEGLPPDGCFLAIPNRRTC